jgi:hypothetical protein
MKVLLDLDKLVREGKLTPSQADELRQFASQDTTLLAINILMAFGVVAVAIGMLALVPSFTTAIALGIVLILLGLAFAFVAGPQWVVLGTAATIVGALALAGGVLGSVEGRWTGFAFATLLFLALAAGIRSGLLSALAVLAIAELLGSSSAYEHAMYFIEVDEPTVTIVLFGALAWLAYLASRQVPDTYESMCLVFARVSLLMVNFGFWVGSLWGDRIGQSWFGHTGDRLPKIPDYVFVIGWAVCLIAVGVWAVRGNQRFVVNLAVTFLAIDFYTQWFERLGAEPLSVLIGGLIVIALAAGLWRYNATARRLHPA